MSRDDGKGSISGRDKEGRKPQKQHLAQALFHRVVFIKERWETPIILWRTCRCILLCRKMARDCDYLEKDFSQKENRERLALSCGDFPVSGLKCICLLRGMGIPEKTVTIRWMISSKCLVKGKIVEKGSRLAPPQEACHLPLASWMGAVS